MQGIILLQQKIAENPIPLGLRRPLGIWMPPQ